MKPPADNLLEHELTPARAWSYLTSGLGCSASPAPAPAPVAAAVGAAASSPAPTGDISALPEGLDGTPIVMLAHERDGSAAGYAIEDSQAGERGAGASSAASAGDLHPFGHRALPGFGQRGQDVDLIGGQAEIWPAKPPCFPGEVGTIGKRAAEATASHQPAGGQPQDPWCRGIPEFAHGRMVLILSRASHSRSANWKPAPKSAQRSTGYPSSSSVT